MLEWSGLRSDESKLLLFCPIETKAREMDAKVLLACVAAERGHKVIVGDMVELRSIIEFLPRGVYLSKSIPDKMEAYFRRYKSLGYAVAAWCEEGLVFLSREVYKKKMVSVGALHYTDLFFAWGDQQAQAVAEKAPASTDKVRRVGNPRIDLLRSPYRQIYRGEAERLRSTYGDYILFNTNFATGNSVIGNERAFLDSKRRGKILTKEDEEHYWEFFEHRRNICEQMMELVGCVSRSYPEKRVIVRPHPSENHEPWEEVAKDLENVDVIFEGTVVPWLMSADVLIHNGCTTAVEAYLLQTPTIAYRPVIKEGYELELPNSVSVEVKNPQEVVEAISFALSKSEGYNRWRRAAEQRLERYVVGVNGAYASDRIVDALEANYRENPIMEESRIYPIARLGMRRARDFLRAIRHGTTKAKTKGDRHTDKHRRQKFPDVSVDEIEELIDSLRRESGRFDGVGVKSLAGARRCFAIEHKVMSCD